MKLTAILLSLFVCFHGAYAQDNFMFPSMSTGLDGTYTHPMVCEFFVSEEMLNDEMPLIMKDYANSVISEPLPSVCTIYNNSGQTRGYLDGWGKWCVTTALGQGKAAMLAACAFACDDMNLTNTSLELPMPIEQRLTDLSSDGQTTAEATLTILDEWLMDELSMGENEDGVLMDFIQRFWLSVHACRLHECEDVAQCQRVADMAFEEILASGEGIELDFEMNSIESLEDARELARLLGSLPLVP